VLRLAVNKWNSGATRAHAQFLKTHGEMVSIPVVLFKFRLASA